MIRVENCRFDLNNPARFCVHESAESPCHNANSRERRICICANSDAPESVIAGIRFLGRPPNPEEGT